MLCLLLLICVLVCGEPIGTVLIRYINDTMIRLSCETVPDCYTTMCRTQNTNDGDVLGIYYLPNRTCDCYFKSSIQQSKDRYNETLLIGGNEQGSMIDSIECDTYNDCTQKMCLLADEPSIKYVSLASTYGDVLDCR